MKDFLFTLLQAVIIAAVPVITTFLCDLIRTKRNEVKARAKSDAAKDLVDDALGAVETAVRVVSQTYVDELKKEDRFSAQNQEDALWQAYDIAVGLMTDEAQNYIGKHYNGMQDWLKAQIEAEVKKQKSQKSRFPY